MPTSKLRTFFTLTEDRLKELQAVDEAFAHGKTKQGILCSGTYYV